MDEREITHYFIVTNQLHRRMVESNLEGMRIHRAQHRLLMTLSCKRSYSQVEIAKELEVSPATIAVALKNLEKEQYIVRTSKEGDNRVKDVLLTEKGQKLVQYAVGIQKRKNHAGHNYAGDEIGHIAGRLQEFFEEIILQLIDQQGKQDRAQKAECQV